MGEQPEVAFWDVDTQKDFILPDGKFHVIGAERLRGHLRKIYALARARRIPVVASVDAHLSNDPEFDTLPMHCVAKTDGQRKLPETLLPKRRVLAREPRKAPPTLQRGEQVILEKCHIDPFTHPSARDIVLKSGIARWVVFGITTDDGVRLAALGLLKLGRRVTLVSDAIHGADAAAARQAVIEMQAAGADFKTTAALLKSLAPVSSRTKVKSKRKG